MQIIPLKFVLAAIALIAFGAYRYYPRVTPETHDQQLTRLRGERDGVVRAIAKDTKILYHAQLHYTSASRRHFSGSVMQRLRAPLYVLRGRIEGAKEEVAGLEQQIAMLEGEQDEVTNSLVAMDETDTAIEKKKDRRKEEK